MPETPVLPGANAVIDIYHGTTIADIAAIKADGIACVIHKATEGIGFQDKEYRKRRDLFKANGFKWGSYHFSSGERTLQQIENYLSYANPEPDELICIDFEPSSSGSDMTLAQLEDCVEIIQSEKGRFPVIYGGHLLREALLGVTTSILANCPLWYARYAKVPIGIPKIWKDYKLWQYTDGNSGLDPQIVGGIGNCDRDTYNGTRAQLLTDWPFTDNNQLVG
jgi:lysozyme